MNQTLPLTNLRGWCRETAGIKGLWTLVSSKSLWSLFQLITYSRNPNVPIHYTLTHNAFPHIPLNELKKWVSSFNIFMLFTTESLRCRILWKMTGLRGSVRHRASAAQRSSSVPSMQSGLKTSPSKLFLSLTLYSIQIKIIWKCKHKKLFINIIPMYTDHMLWTLQICYRNSKLLQLP